MGFGLSLRRRENAGQAFVRAFALTLIAVVTLLVITALVVPGFIDWTPHRDRIAQMVSDRLGVPVAIDGGIDLSVLPTPSLRITDLRVGDAATNPQGPDAASGRAAVISVLDGQLSLVPLFGGQVHLERLVLIEPQVTVTASAETAIAGYGRLVTEHRAALARYRLDRVTVADGSLTVRAPDGAWSERVERISLQTSLQTPLGPGTVAGSAQIRGRAVAFEANLGSLSSAGGLPFSLSVGPAPSADVITLAGLLTPDGGVRGEVTATTADLGQVLADWRIDHDLGDLLARPGELDARLTASQDAVTLNEATIGFGANRLSGAISLARGPVPQLDVALSAGRLDWRDLAPEGGVPALSPARLPALVRRPVPLPTWVTLTLDLGVDALVLGETVIRQGRLNAAISDGVAAVSRFSAQLPAGTEIAAVGTLRNEGPLPFIDLTVETASGDLRGVLGWLGIALPEIPTARLRSFTGVGTLTGTVEEYQLTGVDLSIDATRLQGAMAMIDRGRPGLGLRLAIDRINLDAYRSRPTDDSVRPATPLADPGTPPAQALAAALGALGGRLDLLEAIDANLDIDVGSLTAQGVTAQEISLDATWNKGRLDVREARVGGMLGVSGRVSGSVASFRDWRQGHVSFDLAMTRASRLFERFGITPPVDPRDFGDTQVTGQASGGTDGVSLSVNATAPETDLRVSARLHGPLGDQITASTAGRAPADPGYKA